MAIHEDGAQDSEVLSAKIRDQEEQIAFLHRQQRDVRFLTKRLFKEFQLRINRRARSINTRHLYYKKDESINELLSRRYSSQEILEKIKPLDKQNIGLQKIDLLNGLEKLFWIPLAFLTNIFIKVLKKVKNYV